MRKRLLVPAIIGLVTITNALSWPVASASSSAAAASTAMADTRATMANALLTTAKQYLGAPYAFVGDSPTTGFSCIGLVYYVYSVLHNVPVGQDLVSAYAMAPHVGRADLQPADLVFFAGTVPGMTPLSHVGIYVGNGMMVAADSVQTGVRWDNLNDAYWTAHYAGAARPLAALAGTATSPSQAGESGTGVTPSPTPLPSVAPPPTTTDATPAPVPTTAGVGATLMAQDPSTVVRSGPGNLYMALGTITAGTTMVVLGSDSTWYQVAIADQVGWVPVSAVMVQPAAARNRRVARTPTPVTTVLPTATMTASQPGLPSEDGVSAVPTVAQNPPDGMGTARLQMTVTVTLLNVRVSPQATAQIMGGLTYGTVVSVLQTAGTWARVHLADGSTGWVSRRYLSFTLLPDAEQRGRLRDAPTPVTTQGVGAGQDGSSGLVVVTMSPLDVYRDPSAGTWPIAQVKPGDRLFVVELTPGWMHVLLRTGQRGWVAADLSR